MSLPTTAPPQPDLYSLAERLYNLGDLLLWDDRHDIGYLQYKNRPHYYHGKLEKDHPSIYHHWPIGIGLMALGQLLGTAATLKEMNEAVAEDEDESFNNIQQVDYSIR